MRQIVPFLKSLEFLKVLESLVLGIFRISICNINSFDQNIVLSTA